ncbi:MAG: alpha/beta hydrolase [Lachnospiraceae bacterium]|nr:alpha/beta hydrolase [Lachnospiraceae bacterium]
MHNEVININTGVESRSDYQPTLTTYILENVPTDAKNAPKRPAVIICPGGGYAYTSDREAEPVAMRMVAAGYHAFIVRYSCAPAVFPTQVLEIAKAVEIVRSHADEWNIDTDKIIVGGFSAGGHAAASLAVFWDKEFVWKALGTTKDMIKPNGAMLCYPVITSGEYAHRGSFDNALAENKADEKMLELLSLEKQVTSMMPPTFLWHTWEDGAVPVENTLKLALALRENKISTEIHIYPHGPHGLSLANEETSVGDPKLVVEACQNWIDRAITWIKGL